MRSEDGKCSAQRTAPRRAFPSALCSLLLRWSARALDFKDFHFKDFHLSEEDIWEELGGALAPYYCLEGWDKLWGQPVRMSSMVLLVAYAFYVQECIRCEVTHKPKARRENGRRTPSNVTVESERDLAQS